MQRYSASLPKVLRDFLFSDWSSKPSLRSFALVLASKHPQSSLRRARIGPVLRTEECASDNQSSHLHPLLVTTQLVDRLFDFNQEYWRALKASAGSTCLSPGLQRASAIEPSLSDGVMAYRLSDSNGFKGVLWSWITTRFTTQDQLQSAIRSQEEMSNVLLDSSSRSKS